MLTQRWPPWGVVLLALSLLAAVLILAEGWPGRSQGGAQRLPLPAVAPGAGPPAATVRICVTRIGFCPVGGLRTGDPCSCPHLLRGSVPGHVERLGEEPFAPGREDWPKASEPDDPLSTLGPLYGP